jgi:hypothetical protein
VHESDQIKDNIDQELLELEQEEEMLDDANASSDEELP